ncbi:MFS transporter [Rothia nasimurium]|uniref:MFS transporter n=1 Tax=Rothia nasimurium TaxID=85336 RepID=UPI003BA3564D
MPTTSLQTGNGNSATRSSKIQIFGLSGTPLIAVLTGWFFVVFDGYDLIVYGTVQSRLMEEWGLNPAQAGTVGSTAFLGMMIGAVAMGRISDAIGRKAAILGSVLILSIFTVACGLAPDPILFGAFRFIAGIGLGGLVPSVNAMVADLAPANYRAIWATWMMSGIPIGGSIAAIVGIFVVPSHPDWGWRAMFLFAVIPLVLGIPIAHHVIPANRREEIKEITLEERIKPGFGALLGSTYRQATLLFSFTTVVTLLAWYGLGTWLPRLMQQSGYDLGAALIFTLVLNLGAVLGSFITGWAGDTFGPLRAGVIAATLASVSLFALLTQPPVVLVYIILVLAGVGTHGTQILIIAAISAYYPSELRGTALGFALGFGRIGAVAAPQIAGSLLALNWSSPGAAVASNYILFASAAGMSALLLLFIAIANRKAAPALNKQ